MGELEAARKLRMDGFSFRAIAAELGTSLGKVQRLLAQGEPIKVPKRATHTPKERVKQAAKARAPAVTRQVIAQTPSPYRDKNTQDPPKSLNPRAVVDRMDAIATRLRAIADTQVEAVDGDQRLAVQASLAEARVHESNIGILKAFKELAESDVRSHPQFVVLIERILLALKRHPDAREAVLSALEQEI